MKAYNRYGYIFQIHRIKDNNDIVHIKVLEDKTEIETGYAPIEEVKRIFGYDHKKDDIYYKKYPEYGKLNRIILE